MKDFIAAFKNTSYYKSIIQSSTVLGMYLMGSRCTGMDDKHSDYDIIILTLSSDYIDASDYEFLIYKGKKIHWYYHPVEGLFDSRHSNGMRYTGVMSLRNICKDLIIYENPQYIDTLYNLYKIKDTLSNIGMYGLFMAKKSYIDNVIADGQILERHYTKFLYHLCLASYYLVQEEPDKDFLKSIKHINCQVVSSEYKQLAVERLKIYKNYIETNTIMSNDELHCLYQECVAYE